MELSVQFRNPVRIIDRLAADGYGLVGGIGQYEHVWPMAYVRGPEGIIVVDHLGSQRRQDVGQS